MIAPEGFRLPVGVGYAIAAGITLLFSVLFLWAKHRRALLLSSGVGKWGVVLPCGLFFVG